MKAILSSLLALVVSAAFVSAEEMPFTVQLSSPLSTATNHKGDPVNATVLQPAAFQGDTVLGHVTESKSGNKIHGEAVLTFTFDTLQHDGTAVPISSSITSISNSKGQANVDEEGRVVRKSSNVGKAAAGTGAGALVGGLTHGWKGAAIGAGIGAAASLVVIEVAAQGPKVEFASGSQVGLSVTSRGGPGVAALKPNGAPTEMAAAPSPQSAAAEPAPAAAESGPAVPAAPQTAAGPAGNSGQPDLTAVKIDFIPGEKTVFYDDFSDMASDEPPPHWKVRDGNVELRTGSGIRQLTTVCPARLSLSSDSFVFPKNFTVEIEAVFTDQQPEMNFFAWPKGVDGGETPSWHILLDADEVSMTGPTTEKIGSFRFNPRAVNRPVKIALWVQDGRVRGYVDGERFADVNQMFMPANMKTPDHWTLRERCDRPGNPPGSSWMGLRSIRVAESAPDFSAALSSTGKYVTHGILFDTDSDRLKPESAPVLKAVLRALEKNPNLKLEIDGYTDSTGDAAHNQDLSKRRAEAIRSVLVSEFAVDASRLTANGFGAAKPVASNDTPEGRAQNRRVEFVKR